jgi:hypothetical protein
MSYNREEAVFTELGIQVDRETIEHYCKLFYENAEKYAGLSSLGTNFM